MSAVDEYKDSMLGPNPFCHRRLVDAAIAYLEVELANKTTSRDLCREKCVRLISSLGRVEAERDALRCCGNCGHARAVDDCCDDCTVDDSRWAQRVTP